MKKNFVKTFAFVVAVCALSSTAFAGGNGGGAGNNTGASISGSGWGGGVYGPGFTGPYGSQPGPYSNDNTIQGPGADPASWGGDGGDGN